MSASEVKEKRTWKFWINKEGKPMTGGYYNFKSFKVYWAYNWYIAEQLDKKGFKEQFNTGCQLTFTRYTNYADRYKQK